MKVLIAKKQQILGDGIPPVSQEDETAKEQMKQQAYNAKKSANETKQQMMNISSSKIRKIWHDSKTDSLVNILYFEFEDDHIKTTQKFISHEFKTDEFNSSVNLVPHHNLILPIEYKKISGLLTEDREQIKEVTYVFKSQEILSNIRLVRDEINSLKNASTTSEKMKFVHDLCVAAWFLLTNLNHYWENLDEVLIAEKTNGIIGFLPIRAYSCAWSLELTQPRLVSFTGASFEEGKKFETIDRFHINYLTFFKDLMMNLFGITTDDLLVNQIQQTNEKDHDSVKKRIIALCRSLMQKNKPTQALQTTQSTLFEIYSQELCSTKKSQTQKQRKLEARSDKRNRILDCLNKYKFLYVLDVAKIAGSDLQEFKKHLRSKGQGDCFYYALHLFVKEIVPHLNQFKDLKQQHIKNTELMEAFKRQKAQSLLLFTNDSLDEIHILIDSTVTKRALVPNFGSQIKEDVFFPAEKIVLNNTNQFKAELYTIGLRSEVSGGRFIHSQSDLTLKKGTIISQPLSNILHQIQSVFAENKTPYRNKMKILHMFENGYLIPKSIMNMFLNRAEVVCEAFSKSFKWISAIQAETNLNILEPNEILQVQSTFVELSRLLVAIYWIENKSLPRQLKHSKIVFKKKQQSEKEKQAIDDQDLFDLFEDEPGMAQSYKPEQAYKSEIEIFGDY